MDRTYYIFSPIRHNAILFTGLFICLLLIKPLSIISSEATLFSLVLLLPTFFLARHFGRAEALITILKDKIFIEWTKNFSVRQEQNFSIDFLEIKDWTVDIWNEYYHFRFTNEKNIIIKLSLDKKNGNINNY
ncbi:MAG: hypothetical protein MUF43_13115, partial [Flavobacterium sp.]|nr:hypothetical protein [Flavobacterium sp.]